MQRRSRYLEGAVAAVLARKMAFVGGPRQVGKTTLALSLIGPDADESHPAYLTWDDPRDAARLRRLELPPGEPLLVLDEIHKYARWRNLVKGLYDTERSRRRIVVTGSARLDYYRKGGDSLANRYRYFRLHPFSLRELNPSPSPSDVEALLRFGGFPEPCCSRTSASTASGSVTVSRASCGRTSATSNTCARSRSRAARRPAPGTRRLAAVGEEPARGSPAIRYFAERTAIPRFFQVHLGDRPSKRAGRP